MALKNFNVDWLAYATRCGMLALLFFVGCQSGPNARQPAASRLQSPWENPTQGIPVQHIQPGTVFAISDDVDAKKTAPTNTLLPAPASTTEKQTKDQNATTADQGSESTDKRSSDEGDEKDDEKNGAEPNKTEDAHKRIDELDKKYDKLNDQYGSLTKDHEKLQSDFEESEEKYNELKAKLKNAVFAGNKDAPMKLTGRIHADLWGFPHDSPGVNAFESGDPTIGPQDRIGFRRMRFGVAGDLPSNMLYKIEMEFAGGNDAEFRDAFLGWEKLPVFQTVLLGNQKRPYGLDHLNSSRYNVFLERPFVIEGFNQDSRRFGLQSYGFSEDLAWNWRYGVFNLRLIQDEGNYVSDHWQSELAGRLANTFWYDEGSDGRGYGHFAISGSYADPDGSGLPGRASNEARFRTRPEARTASRWLDTRTIDGADDYELLGVENVWNFGSLQIVAEYQNLWVQRRADSQVHLHGGYVYLAYFLTGEHMPWDRESGTLDRIHPFENFFLVDTCCDGAQGGLGAWQLAYRWSYADFSNQDILGGVGNSHTLGLNWYWTPYSRMQFNAGYGTIDEHAPVAGQTAGDYTFIGARFMVDF